MSEAALLGVPRPFVYRGKNYSVAIRDFFIELAFADWVMAEAGLALDRMRPRWTANFFAEQNKAFNSQIVGKRIRWGSAEVHDASWSDEGQRQLLYLKMKRGEENGSEPVERELIDQIANDKDDSGESPKYAELLRIMMEQDYPFLLEQTKPKKPENPSPPASPSSSPPPDTTPKA